MDKKKKVVNGSVMQEFDGGEIGANAMTLKSDLRDMRLMLTQVKQELEDGDGFNIIFHVSLLWPVTLINPGIKVLITLKDTHEDEDVATWERVMHATDTSGWETSLSQILHIAKEMDLDYLIMENANSSETQVRWLQ